MLLAFFKRPYSRYGPETNFWLHFRPYLSCKHNPRLGPELAGRKFWCNPEYFDVESPAYVFSAGSGNDFNYEKFVQLGFPDVKVVVADCFTGDSPEDIPLTYMDKCLHGTLQDDTENLGSLGAKFVDFPTFVEEVCFGSQKIVVYKASMVFLQPIFRYARLTPI